MLRHEKPFKCTFEGCSRSSLGFSTRNDQDRHQKSVHKIAPTTATDKTFKCAHPNCKTPAKIWPRADNFRQHCQRLHPDWDTDVLVNRSLVPSAQVGYSKAPELGI